MQYHDENAATLMRLTGLDCIVSRPSTFVLLGIRWLQRSMSLIFRKLPFERLPRKLASDFMRHPRLFSIAMLVLQEERKG